jgi:hypothetical protein
MRTVSAKTYAALTAADVTPELALDAAAELGEIAGEVRILKWMVGASIGLTLVMLAMLFQIALRLP